jgi:type IV secretory pathway VirB10-like protein
VKHAKATVFFLLVAGCAVAPKSPSSEPAAPASAATAGGPPSTPAAAPQAAPVTTPAPREPAAEPALPAEADSATASVRKSDKAPSKDAPAASRSTAEVRGDLERAQRELDIAGSDCRTACRALGSMDRAAGRLCTLARSSDERDRCSDASAKVKTARDKVKRTCTSCPDVSVERDAAIPSR